MNRTTTAPNAPLTETGGYQRTDTGYQRTDTGYPRTDTGGNQRSHRPAWIRIALVAGAIALAAAAYAAFDRDDGRERDTRRYGVGESGQTIERGSQRSGTGYGVGTEGAVRYQGEGASSNGMAD